MNVVRYMSTQPSAPVETAQNVKAHKLQALLNPHYQMINTICDRFRCVDILSMLPDGGGQRGAAINVEPALDSKDTQAVPKWRVQLNHTCRNFEVRNKYLNHISGRLAVIKYTVECCRITARLQQVNAFLQAEGVSASYHIPACIRSIHEPRWTTPGTKPPGWYEPLPGVAAAGYLRRDAHSCRSQGLSSGDERYLQQAQILEECATAAQRALRLWIELQLQKVDSNIANYRNRLVSLASTSSEPGTS